MNNTIEPLIDLQDTDGRIRELEQESRDLPKRMAHETARMQGSNSALTIAKNQLATTQQRIKESESEIDALNAKARDLKTSQATMKSNKEFSQVTMQIEGLEREVGESEARQLAMMDTLATLERNVRVAQAKVDAEQGGVDGYVSELETRLAEVKKELENLVKERAEKAAKVPPRFLLYYERLRTKRWPVVVSLTEEGVCDGCHLKQPPSVSQMVQHNVVAAEKGLDQQLVACTMCGRILYRDL